MFRRIFGAALGAGLAVGLVIALVQQVALVPLIMKAEVYESGKAATHKHSALQAPADSPNVIANAIVTPAHAHGAAATADGKDEPWRDVLTWIATTLATIGFSLLLVGAYAVSGRNVDAREGLMWGIAGFAAFALAPAFGLPPELPGSVAAELVSRQVWWIGTVVATAGGIGLLVFMRANWATAVAVLLLLAPHVIGAPHPHEGAGVVPPELAASFAARSIAVNALTWALLGLATGALYSRFGRARLA